MQRKKKGHLKRLASLMLAIMMVFATSSLTMVQVSALVIEEIGDDLIAGVNITFNGGRFPVVGDTMYYEWDAFEFDLPENVYKMLDTSIYYQFISGWILGFSSSDLVPLHDTTHYNRYSDSDETIHVPRGTFDGSNEYYLQLAFYAKEGYYFDKDTPIENFKLNGIEADGWSFYDTSSDDFVHGDTANQIRVRWKIPLRDSIDVSLDYVWNQLEPRAGQYIHRGYNESDFKGEGLSNVLYGKCAWVTKTGENYDVYGYLSDDLFSAKFPPAVEQYYLRMAFDTDRLSQSKLAEYTVRGISATDLEFEKQEDGSFISYLYFPFPATDIITQATIQPPPEFVEPTLGGSMFRTEEQSTFTQRYPEDAEMMTYVREDSGWTTFDLDGENREDWSFNHTGIFRDNKQYYLRLCLRANGSFKFDEEFMNYFDYDGLWFDFYEINEDKTEIALYERFYVDSGKIWELNVRDENNLLNVQAGDPVSPIAEQIQNLTIDAYSPFTINPASTIALRENGTYQHFDDHSSHVMKYGGEYYLSLLLKADTPYYFSKDMAENYTFNGRKPDSYELVGAGSSTSNRIRLYYYLGRTDDYIPGFKLSIKEDARLPLNGLLTRISNEEILGCENRHTRDKDSYYLYNVMIGTMEDGVFHSKGGTLATPNTEYVLRILFCVDEGYMFSNANIENYMLNGEAPFLIEPKEDNYLTGPNACYMYWSLGNSGTKKYSGALSLAYTGTEPFMAPGKVISTDEIRCAGINPWISISSKWVYNNTDQCIAAPGDIFEVGKSYSVNVIVAPVTEYKIAPKQYLSINIDNLSDSNHKPESAVVGEHCMITYELGTVEENVVDEIIISNWSQPGTLGIPQSVESIIADNSGYSIIEADWKATNKRNWFGELAEEDVVDQFQADTIYTLRLRITPNEYYSLASNKDLTIKYAGVTFTDDDGNCDIWSYEYKDKYVFLTFGPTFKIGVSGFGFSNVKAPVAGEAALTEDIRNSLTNSMALTPFSVDEIFWLYAYGDPLDEEYLFVSGEEYLLVINVVCNDSNFMPADENYIILSLNGTSEFMDLYRTLNVTSVNIDRKSDNLVQFVISFGETWSYIKDFNMNNLGYEEVAPNPKVGDTVYCMTHSKNSDDGTFTLDGYESAAWYTKNASGEYELFGSLTSWDHFAANTVYYARYKIMNIAKGYYFSEDYLDNYVINGAPACDIEIYSDIKGRQDYVYLYCEYPMTTRAADSLRELDVTYADFEAPARYGSAQRHEYKFIVADDAGMVESGSLAWMVYDNEGNLVPADARINDYGQFAPDTQYYLQMTLLTAQSFDPCFIQNYRFNGMSPVAMVSVDESYYASITLLYEFPKTEVDYIEIGSAYVHAPSWSPARAGQTTVRDVSAAYPFGEHFTVEVESGGWFYFEDGIKDHEHLRFFARYDDPLMTFEPGVDYYVSIVFRPESGYRFTDDPNNSYLLNNVRPNFCIITGLSCEAFYLFGTEDETAPTVIPSFDLGYEGGIPAPVAGNYTNLSNIFTGLPTGTAVDVYNSGYKSVTLPTMQMGSNFDLCTEGFQFLQNTHYYFVLCLTTEDGYCFDNANLEDYRINGVAPVFMTSDYARGYFYYDYPATVLRVYNMIDEFNIDTSEEIIPPVPGGDSGRGTAWMSQSFEHFTLDTAKWVEKGAAVGSYTDFGMLDDYSLRFGVNKIYGLYVELTPEDGYKFSEEDLANLKLDGISPSYYEDIPNGFYSVILVYHFPKTVQMNVSKYAPISDFTYTIDGNELTITGYTGSDMDVFIAPEYEIDSTMYKVVAIGEEAFFGNSSVYVVSLPTTVRTIGDYAFYNCPNLIEIRVSGNPVSIGEKSMGYKNIGTNMNPMDVVSDVVVCGFVNGLGWSSTIKAYTDANGVNFKSWYDGKVSMDAPYAPVSNEGLIFAVSTASEFENGFMIFTVDGNTIVVTDKTLVGGKYQFVLPLSAIGCVDDVLKVEYVIGNTVIETMDADVHSFISNLKNCASHVPGPAATEHTPQVCTVCGKVLVPALGEAAVGNPRIVLESVTATTGKTVDVKVWLLDNPGISTLVFGLDYDANVFTLVGMQNGELFMTPTTGAMFLYSSAANVTESGLLMTLTFEVNENATPGEYSIGIVNLAANNEYEQDVVLARTNATAEVIEFVYGDIGGDGVINAMDATRLMNYIANYVNGVQMGEVSVEIATGADVNADGKVDGKDLTRLLRYLANYDANGNLLEGGVEVPIGPQRNEVL